MKQDHQTQIYRKIQFDIYKNNNNLIFKIKGKPNLK